MAVARVEWQCPGCERRFAIRADMETPELCPQCRAQTGTGANDSAADPRGVPDGSGNSLATPFPDFSPAEPPGDVVPPRVPPQSAVPLRKYPALKILSVVYKVLAVLIALGGLVALIVAVVQAFTAEETSIRSAVILMQLGGFVASLFVAVTMYASGELVQLLIDIEWNTRAARNARE